MTHQTNQIHYDNAPITEAIIDFRVDLPAYVSLEILKKAFEDEKGLYKVDQDINRASFTFKLDHNNPSAQSEGSIIGFFLKSLDEKRIFQIKLDGFTSGRLAPYQDWDDFRNETRRLWDIYCKATSPLKVSRAALRYINRIDINLPIEELGDYFNNAPRIPSPPPQELANYFTQMVIHLDDIGTTAILNQGTAPASSPDILPIILDIDVFKEADSNIDNVWDSIEALRVQKNKIFEACITDKVREIIS